MRTKYLTDRAVTSFESSQALARFLAHAGGLQVLDVDHQRLYIIWKF